VATRTTPPPPAPQGNWRFVAIGLVFLVAAGVLWAVLGKQEPAAPEPIAKPEAPARVNPMAEQELELEEPEPEPEPEPEREPEVTKKPSGGARAGEWDCTADLDPKAASAVIAQHRAQVRTCYERRLKVNNILQGDLQLKIKVSASGKVVASNVSGSLRDSDVFECVRRVAASWQFPSPTGGNCAVMRVPFSFSPKS
jgi:outer membrane biosynthesis protein TonB